MKDLDCAGLCQTKRSDGMGGSPVTQPKVDMNFQPPEPSDEELADEFADVLQQIRNLIHKAYGISAAITDRDMRNDLLEQLWETRP